MVNCVNRRGINKFKSWKKFSERLISKLHFQINSSKIYINLA